MPRTGRMQTIPIIDLPGVGTVVARPHGGWNWNWRHLDGTDTMTDSVPGQNTLEWRWYAADGTARLAIESYQPDGQPADFFTRRHAIASLLADHFGLGLTRGGEDR